MKFTCKCLSRYSNLLHPCPDVIDIEADTESDNIFPRKLTPEVLQALRGVRFIAQHIKDADKDNEVIR